MSLVAEENLEARVSLVLVSAGGVQWTEGSNRRPGKERVVLTLGLRSLRVWMDEQKKRGLEWLVGAEVADSGVDEDVRASGTVLGCQVGSRASGGPWPTHRKCEWVLTRGQC